MSPACKTSIKLKCGIENTSHPQPVPDLNKAARQTLEIAVANNDDVVVVVFIVIVDVNHYYVFFFPVRLPPSVFFGLE